MVNGPLGVCPYKAFIFVGIIYYFLFQLIHGPTVVLFAAYKSMDVFAMVFDNVPRVELGRGWVN